MRTKQTIGFLTVVAVGIVGGQIVLSQGSDQSRPFTATIVESTFLPGEETPRVARMKTIAVRSDGSWVEAVQTEASGEVQGILLRRKITDVANRKRVVVDPLTESITTYPLSHAAAQAFAIKSLHSCEANGTRLGTDRILGFDVDIVEVQKRYDSPAVSNTRRMKSWVAPELDCFPLRREIEMDVASKPTKKAIEAVTNISMGEPDRGLFEIPSNYKERSPSEVLAEAGRRFPNRFGACKGCRAGNMQHDDVYNSANQRKD